MILKFGSLVAMEQIEVVGIEAKLGGVELICKGVFLYSR